MTDNLPAKLTTLAQCEAMVKKHKNAGLLLGAALTVIKANFDGWGLKNQYANWENYLETKHDITKNYGNRLIRAAEIKTVPIGTKIKTESQARAVWRIPDVDRQAAVDAASADGPVTAQKIAKAGKRIAAAKNSEPVAPPSPSEQAKADEGHMMHIMNKIQVIRKELEAMALEPIGAFLHIQQIDAFLVNARVAIKFARPHIDCPYCKGEKCKECRKTGWLPKDVYDRVPIELKGGGK